MTAARTVLWYPFRSDQVRDICEHLTDEERRRMAVSPWVGGGVGAMISLATFPTIWLLGLALRNRVSLAWYPVVLFLLAIPIGILIGSLVTTPLRRRMRRVLCATEYARQIGYTPETLPLYSSQFHLRTLLVWGVPLAALAAWIAAWSGPFDSGDQQARFNPLLKMNLIMLLIVVWFGVFALVRSRARASFRRSGKDA